MAFIVTSDVVMCAYYELVMQCKSLKSYEVLRFSSTMYFHAEV